jgi:hypothetical protein
MNTIVASVLRSKAAEAQIEQRLARIVSDRLIDRHCLPFSACWIPAIFRDLALFCYAVLFLSVPSRAPRSVWCFSSPFSGAGRPLVFLWSC